MTWQEERKIYFEEVKEHLNCGYFREAAKLMLKHRVKLSEVEKIATTEQLVYVSKYLLR